MECGGGEKWDRYLMATCSFNKKKEQFPITGWIAYLMPEEENHAGVHVCVCVHTLGLTVYLCLQCVYI